MTSTTIDAGVLGTGFYVPERILTNFDLEKMVDTSDEWIVERTGIHERRIAPDDMPASELAYRAAIRALADAHTEPEEIDLIICATLTGDAVCPSTASFIQAKLGASHAAAFDLTAACSGFVYSSTVAAQFIQSGVYRRVLVIGVEVLSHFLDWKDRNTCVLFGDGAGAAVYGPVEKGFGILGFDMGCDGTGTGALGIASGDRGRALVAGQKHNCVYMNGAEVFKFAVRAMGATMKRSLERAGLRAEDVDWLVPHQANIRIIQSAAKRLALPQEKVIINIGKYGNVSAASIPMALAEAAGEGRFRKGDIVVLAGFGAGLTWASCIMRWAKEDL